jgi:hypothetical protein
VAGSLSQRRAHLPRGLFAGRDEARIAPHPLHEPGRALPAGFQVARKVHAAHHALPRVFCRARQQLRAAFGQHIGQ